MKKPGLSRRTFLRGAGGVAVGLPLLNIMGCSERRNPAAGAGALGSVALGADGFPKRFVVFFSANGTIRENWRPSGGETDFTLSPILSPLEPHRNDLVIIDGVDMVSSRNGPGDGHQRGMAHMLTGTEILEGDLFTGGGGELAGWGGGISVDQAIANAIGGGTKFKSLELGVQVRSATIWSRMSYLGADQPIPPEDDPYAAFNRIFGDLDDDPLGVEQRVRRRRAVLDSVIDDYAALESRLGAEDRARLGNHLESIRDIERRLDNNGQLGGACEKPDLGQPIDIYANDNYPAIGRLQMDLLVMALACDLTRVASIQWSRSVSNTVFSWLDNPVPEGHHDLSHEGDSNAVAIDKLTRINTWYASQLGYLIQRMKEIPEGDGTMLDNTCILWCNELGRGNSHTRNDAPWLLAGGAGGAIPTGRYLSYDGDVPHNNLHVSLLNAYGIETDTFGNPAYATGPLSGLL